ncbi:hypothetical protein [Streptomyces brasiliensis]|uniref:Uncharacterized protein n=1 Tax=Streptomyces brasiliensis TaxID=1954 RepID=A0A917P697_9ACTN|nr:hypothetical protein [Streptomyces brasiliensis]GGJ63791.1 hypothetical protein GCM10010121_088030 [Streptomyces brasiliensis]
MKINIGSALNIAFTRAVRDAPAAQPDLTDPRPYLARGRRRWRRRYGFCSRW